MELLSKEDLVQALRDLRNRGWIQNARQGNDGGIGNTLEDVLGIEENNLPIPNAAEWELKCQRIDSNALTTLFHMEPSPRVIRFVSSILLPKYGWLHQQAGRKYPVGEMSFRQTINALSRTDRGFGIIIDRDSRKAVISFDASKVDNRHSDWLKALNNRVGLEELNPQPYWGFSDLYHKAGTKLLNCVYVQAEVKKIDGIEYYHYSKMSMFQNFSPDHFIQAIESGNILIDFDARTGHNHGTKFRLRQGGLSSLYHTVKEI